MFLVRVDQVRYSRERQKPFYTVWFSVLEPQPQAGRTFSGRLFCTPKALWKFSWFLRDFGYDPELLGGLCLGKQDMIYVQPIRRPGGAITSAG